MRASRHLINTVAVESFISITSRRGQKGHTSSSLPASDYVGTSPRTSLAPSRTSFRLSFPACERACRLPDLLLSTEAPDFLTPAARTPKPPAFLSNFGFGLGTLAPFANELGFDSGSAALDDGQDSGL